MTTAASFVPSLLDVMEAQFPDPALVCSVQLAPESVDVWMRPPDSTAAKFVPSLLEVMDFQYRRPEFVCAVQLAPESVDV